MKSWHLLAKAGERYGDVVITCDIVRALAANFKRCDTPVFVYSTFDAVEARNLGQVVALEARNGGQELWAFVGMNEEIPRGLAVVYACAPEGPTPVWLVAVAPS